jgi:protein SCO1/2
MLCLTMIGAALLLPLATMIGPARRRSALRPAAVLAIMAMALALLPVVAARPVAAQAQAAAAGRPFTLVDQNGRTVTAESYRGKWLLVYFGYTHCPDACPTALSNMAAALDLLDAAMRERLQPIFVTVDPERDTPTVMKDYVDAFEGSGIVGLSGTSAQVAAIRTEYRINVQRHDEGGGEYSIDHTSVIHIVDPAGHFAGLVSNLMQPDRLAKRLTQLVE